MHSWVMIINFREVNGHFFKNKVHFQNILVAMTYLQDVRGKYFASLVFQWQSILPAIDAGTKDKNNKRTIDGRISRKNHSPGVNLDMSRIFRRKTRKFGCRNDHWPWGGSKLNKASIYFYTRLSTKMFTQDVPILRGCFSYGLLKVEKCLFFGWTVACEALKRKLEIKFSY